jgi:hypothetical protein
MINKNSQEWKSQPFLIKVTMFTERSRKNALRSEYAYIIIGILAFISAFFVYKGIITGTLFWLLAYNQAITIRWIDKADLWGEDEK